MAAFGGVFGPSGHVLMWQPPPPLQMRPHGIAAPTPAPHWFEYLLSLAQDARVHQVGPVCGTC